jgi:hypothetical protein
MEVSMPKARSPGYPTIGLREAIEKINLVYEKDYQNRIGRQIVAGHMGYNSLNGKSLGVLSAVTKFGLLEGRGEEYRVSDLALQIIAHAPGTPERAAAIAEAATRPELFSDLDSKFQNGKASDAAIRSYLITQHFIPQAADTTIRSYRETKALVNEEPAGYSGEAPSPLASDPSAVNSTGNEASQQRRAPVGATTVAALHAGEREILRGPLSHDKSWRLFVSGDIGAKELGKIIRFLTLQQEFLLESDAEEDGAPEA